jgi:hypothetical protein
MEDMYLCQHCGQACKKMATDPLREIAEQLYQSAQCVGNLPGTIERAMRLAIKAHHLAVYGPDTSFPVNYPRTMERMVELLKAETKK